MTLCRRPLLIVDDDPIIRATVARVLADEGEEAIVAATAEEALGLMGAGLRPGVILLDLTMPGMSPAAFMRARVALDGAAAIPVFVFSATRDAADQLRAIGADGLVPKPANLEDILALTERYCR